jgi:DinB superfamily
MTREERERLLADLESGRQAVVDVLRGVTEAQASLRPAADRWSILECVEHLALAEDFLFGRILAAEPEAARVGDPQREAKIMERGADRSRPLQAPDVARPTARFSTLAEAVEHLAASRQQTIEFVRGCGQDLRAQVTTHPLVKQPNCYEVLLMMAAHPHRHAKQLAEIKAAV